MWQDAAVPWNGQVALAAPRINAAALRQAYNDAIALHPLAACSVECDDRGGYRWVHHDAVDVGEIVVVECPDEASLDGLRVEQLDRPLAMDGAPLIRVVIARTPDEDVAISCISHVMSDGLGMFRLMRSVGRAYRGLPDPGPAIDIAAAHRVLSPEPPTSWSALTKRWSQRLRVASAQLVARSRLAESGGTAAGGFGLVTRRLDVHEITRVRRTVGASFDVYAMAALHVAIQRWNRDHDAGCDVVGVAQGVNLRPDAWWDDVVVNLAAFASVRTDPADRADVRSALARVLPQLDRQTRREQASEVAGAARAARILPATARRDALASLRSDHFDTCVISNTGVHVDPPRLSDDGESLSWFATPAMPLAGPTIATGVVDDQVQFNVCYRRERLDDAGANAFVDAFIATLRGG